MQVNPENYCSTIIAATIININKACSSQLCFLCTDSCYHSGKGHHKGSADKIALFVSPDKAMPRPDFSGHRSLTDIKACTKNQDLREEKQGTGQTLTIKSGRIDKTASTSFVYPSGLLEKSQTVSSNSAASPHV